MRYIEVASASAVVLHPTALLADYCNDIRAISSPPLQGLHRQAKLICYAARAYSKGFLVARHAAKQRRFYFLEIWGIGKRLNAK